MYNDFAFSSKLGIPSIRKDILLHIYLLYAQWMTNLTVLLLPDKNSWWLPYKLSIRIVLKIDPKIVPEIPLKIVP